MNHLILHSEPVDLPRYLGRWYEMARKPMPYQEALSTDVSAEYSLNEKGTISVHNRCINPNGQWAEVFGEAKSFNSHNTQLKVSFLPSYLRWLPIGWGNYWILKLDADYQTVLIGEPLQRYLWLLNRTPKIHSDILKDYLNCAQENGYDLSDLIYTPHHE